VHQDAHAHHQGLGASKVPKGVGRLFLTTSLFTQNSWPLGSDDDDDDDDDDVLRTSGPRIFLGRVSFQWAFSLS
jgi:hypothetical protein